jgi:hypothetical protein
MSRLVACLAGLVVGVLAVSYLAPTDFTLVFCGLLLIPTILGILVYAIAVSEQDSVLRFNASLVGDLLCWYLVGALVSAVAGKLFFGAHLLVLIFP